MLFSSSLLVFILSTCTTAAPINGQPDHPLANGRTGYLLAAPIIGHPNPPQAPIDNHPSTFWRFLPSTTVPTAFPMLVWNFLHCPTQSRFLVKQSSYLVLLTNDQVRSIMMSASIVNSFYVTCAHKLECLAGVVPGSQRLSR